MIKPYKERIPAKGSKTASKGKTKGKMTLAQAEPKKSVPKGLKTVSGGVRG